MTVKGGTNNACAACKYQRRRCPSDCPLAAYFPADQPKQFQNCHRLFGVSNILKIINRLDPPQKAEAMKSIIYEANIRDRDPVHGCLGVICTLHLQIQHLQLELDTATAQLALYRHHHHQSLQLASPLSSGSSPITGTAANCLLFDNGISIVESCSRADNSDINTVGPFWAHNSHANNDSTGNSIVAHDYDDIAPYFDTIDEDGAYESSSESSLKDTMQSTMEHVSQNELKSAAACFTLTNAVN
ncbi:unnamed protein product [Musa acuminata subsp. malaccensis]|uniref:(wild Malaysian banana) hypothetical protein n=1 Tax=Musa acuminata subsp. malaccensis TaxID=214687 RepID=A0A8D6ZTY8_MUSAM|nr:unnamed protein product [Musa acuminata subsp. malaccensis]